ncbi:MAG: class I SAM-dependent methyltransferase [Saprospiraceae bacterium]|nr:class I SAM-dependent methyltransferase [Saprospiraceae bacterium]
MDNVNYGEYWDRFYHATYQQQPGGKALWDVPVHRSAALDLVEMDHTLPKELPLLDVGCGTGEIASFFTKHFPKVIGVDVAQGAIDIAIERQTDAHIDFKILDITDATSCLALSEQYGPLNIYIRGVMHQVEENHLPQYVNNLETLLGGKGVLYMIEVASGIRDHFLHHSEGYHKLPAAVQKIFISNLPPRGVTVEGIATHFPPNRFEILKSNPEKLFTNLQSPDGMEIYIPAVQAIIKAKKFS